MSLVESFDMIPRELTPEESAIAEKAGFRLVPASGWSYQIVDIASGSVAAIISATRLSEALEDWASL